MKSSYTSPEVTLKEASIDIITTSVETDRIPFSFSTSPSSASSIDVKDGITSTPTNSNTIFGLDL